MNKNLLKWILIAVVILGAAGYLILSETSSNNRKEKIVVGHSKPFKIEPVEGITISAPKNALDKDRKFKLSPVDDKTYDKVVEQLQGEDLKPLAVLELDAGLKPSDCLPGDYEVVFDLDGMGIPRRLQDKVVVYRGAGSDDELGFSKYNTRVSNGKLTYKSNQNSKLVLGLRHRPESGWTSTKAFWFRLPSSHVKYAMSTWGSGGNPLELLRGNWEEFKNTKWKTVHLYFALESSHSIFVQHESGDFRIFFRFIDTEDADRYHDWLDNDDAFEERLQELEKEANRIWEAKAKKIFDKEYKDHKEWDFWGWVYSKKRANEIKASINKEEIYDSLVMNDMKGNGVLAKLNADPKGKLPKSLEDVIDDIIRANQYLNDMGLHRLNSAIDVFLLNSSATGADGSAKNYNLYASSPGFLFLNYDNYFSKPEKIQLTCVHELCHMRQFYYGMPKNPQEATVVVVERDAARKWYGKYITNDPESRNTLADIMTNRANHEMFGYPLDKPVFRDDGYTMGDALEGIRKGIGKEKENMTPFMISFPYYGPYTGFLAKGIRKIMGEDHADNTWTGWIKEAFQINDEQLNQGWNYFGATHLPLIYNSQSVRNSEKSTPKEIATFHISLKPDNPVAQLPQNRLHRDYAVNTFCIDLPPKPKDVMEEAANVYVCCEDKEPNPYVRFYWSDWEFNEYLESKHGDTYLLKAEPSLFYAGNRETDYARMRDGSIMFTTSGKKVKRSKSGYQLAVVTTSQSKGPRCNYYVVALFKPEAQNINKVDDDVITFRVPKPDKDLRKKGLVVGAEYTYTAKDGHTETLTVSPDQFGEKVNWNVANCGKSGNEFSISFHWFYKQDDNTICVSPESEKTMFNIGEKEEKKKKEKKEEPIVIDEKEGYWKQVSSNVKVVNTTDDTDPSDNSDATKDLRSLQVLRENDQELEFIGIATTEVKEDGEIHYEKDFYLDGYVNYTEPPKQWPARTNYTCEWYTDKDPFLLKMKKPFTFEVENTTSAPKACDKGKDKVTENKSKTADGKWLNQVKTVFKTNKPKKDDPRAFTIEQKYTVNTFAGSNKKVSVVLTYNYEWVEGEMEPEPEVKKESTPKDGYWKLVKTEVDDSKISAQGVDKNLTYNNYIEGKDGVYLVHGECGYEKYWKKPLIKVTHERTIKTERPKKIYTPGETIRLKIQYGATKITPTDEPNAKNVIHGHSVANFDYGCTDVPSYQGSFGWEQEGATYTGPGTTGTAGEDCRTRIAPTKGYDWTGNTFLIIETVRSSTGNTVELKITYHYEWVDGGKKAEPVKEPAKEKPITGGHWKLALTSVVDETASYTSSDGEEKIQITGSNGHYSVHAEYTKKGKTYCTMDREINFEKPKSTYKPEEILKLEITNEKVKLKGKPEYGLYPHGEHIFSNFYKDDYSYDAIRNPKKVVSTTTYEVSKKNCSAGTIGFSIHERARFGMAEVRTNYLYEWVD